MNQVGRTNGWMENVNVCHGTSRLHAFEDNELRLYGDVGEEWAIERANVLVLASFCLRSLFCTR